MGVTTLFMGVTVQFEGVRATPTAWDRGRTTVPASFTSSKFLSRGKNIGFRQGQGGNSRRREQWSQTLDLWARMIQAVI